MPPAFLPARLPPPPRALPHSPWPAVPAPRDVADAAHAPLAPGSRRAMSGGGVPYLGSRIVLISKSEIRYEGTLYTIDTGNSTVALQNVRSFGTEGRRNGVKEIPPNDTVTGTVKFRVDLIKDIKIVKEAPAETETGEDALDPAIVE